MVEYKCLICKKQVAHDSTLFCSRNCELKYIKMENNHLPINSPDFFNNHGYKKKKEVTDVQKKNKN